jgi:hypothetical protein
MRSLDESFALVLILIIAFSSLSLLMVKPANAQGFSFSYGGNYPYNDLNDSPAIVFSVANGSVVHNSPNNLTLGFVTGIGSAHGLQTLMTTLTSVSYRASWQANQSITLYKSTIDTPSILTYVPSGQGDFSYNFTNIPLGSQKLEVDVVGGGIIWGGNTYYTFYTNSSSTLNFTVQTAPTEESFPTLLVVVVTVLVVALAAVGLLVYFRKRKR